MCGAPTQCIVDGDVLTKFSAYAVLTDTMMVQVSESSCVTVSVQASEVKRDGTLVPLTSTATLDFLQPVGSAAREG